MKLARKRWMNLWSNHITYICRTFELLSSLSKDVFTSFDKELANQRVSFGKNLMTKLESKLEDFSKLEEQLKQESIDPQEENQVVEDDTITQVLFMSNFFNVE